MPQVTVFADFRRPEGPTIDRIAEILKVSPESLAVDRTKKPVGYVTVSIPPIGEDTRKRIQALDAVSKVG